MALTGKRGEREKGPARAEDPTFGLSLPQQIAKVIAGEIVERELPFGERLPELDLAARFGTSRAPIREALYILAQEGLVERTPRRGAVVRQFDTREIEELYQVRALLESLALEYIFNEPDDAQRTALVSALEQVVRTMKDARKDTKRYHALNFEFHKTILEVAGRELLLNLYRQIEGPLKVFLRLSLETPGAVALSLDEHRKLLDAIARGDLNLASNILANHDRDGMQRAITFLSSRTET
ncbi:MAG TPA: GntR family transcriptional regulator [Rubrobacteraceae bacterium]|nr:GntR family transcriptional regulator [Rubrobacteraceae bacterium]